MSVVKNAMGRVRERLSRLYGEDRAGPVFEALGTRLTDSTPPFPRKLWSEKDAVLIVYGDSVLNPPQPPLQSLRDFVAAHTADTLNITHILPFYPETSDDGFSVSDYTAVRHDLGSWEDVGSLNRSTDLMFDLVLNHCSASHPWFQQFLKNEEPGRRFFHSLDPETDLREVVRPRTHPLLTPFETRAGTRHVWTTFSADQVDLNFGEPDVLLAFVDLLLLYARRGARIIRLDAIAFLWKTPGTSCIHLPQTHEVVKLMRDVLELTAPEVVLLTETNVPHAENISYFGNGDEARMVYQFPLPPLLLHGLRRGTARALTRWAEQLEPPPPGCTFFNFTASHDGIGVRPLEGLVPPEEVRQLADEIRSLGGKVNERTGPDGTPRPYELNATFFSALEIAGEPPEKTFRRFLLSQTVPMCLQGVPAFYIHSLTATPNDREGLARTGQNRSINRKKWTRSELDPLLADSGSPAARALATITRRLKIRSNEPLFHPDTPQTVLDAHPEVFVIRRGNPGGPFLTAAHNFSDKPVTLDLSGDHIVAGDAGVEQNGGKWLIPPLSFVWLK